MSIHLVEMPLELRQLHGWAANRGFGRGGLDEGLALHHLLAETFGPGALQPFRLMVAPRAVQGTLYAYSDRPAEALRETAWSVAGPTEADVLPLDRLRSVPRPPETWREGMRLGFDLKARPTVRLASDLETDRQRFSKGAEMDSFLAETLRNDRARTREEVYLDWLAARLAPVAALERDGTRMHGFRRKRAKRGGRSLEGPEVVFHGTLAVRDPHGFAGMLARGTGRHRAYGYGMLLLRPPQRRA